MVNVTRSHSPLEPPCIVASVCTGRLPSNSSALSKQTPWSLANDFAVDLQTLWRWQRRSLILLIFPIEPTGTLILVGFF